MTMYLTRSAQPAGAHPNEVLSRRLLGQFRSAFNAEPRWLVQAPGRVNLIGEHTDYNDGFVLPCAIDFQTQVAVSLRPDRRVRVVAADFGGQLDSFDLDQPMVRRSDAPWADYVRGMTWAMLQAGMPLRGVDLAIAGNVPQGAGLSSSASLELAVGQAFKVVMGDKEPEAGAMARLAQRAENEFVGCQCGIMDQLISARGQAGHALLIDCRSLDVVPVRLPDDVAVLVVHSGVERGLVDSEYNARRRQCEAVALHCDVPALRDLDLPALGAAEASLEASPGSPPCSQPTPVEWRRARHVVTENARTLAAADALAAGDLVFTGQLMAESHASMRDDFEITVPAIDSLVDILSAAIGPTGGARMTGGGFGGCVVALLPQARVPQAIAAVKRRYRSPRGETAAIYVCQPSAGASSV